MIQVISPVAAIRFLECQNGSGEVIPAFAVMRVTGVTDNVLQVAKPNAASDTKAVVNGPTPIPIAGKGNATYDSPYFVLYETADGTPAFGESWGTENGSFKLRKGNDGFSGIGGATAGRALFASKGMMGGASASLTVRDVILGDFVLMVTTLEFADGLDVTSPVANTARVTPLLASLTQRGIISLSAQTLGDGDKTFPDNAYLNANASAFISWTDASVDYAQIIGTNFSTEQLRLNVRTIGSAVGSNPFSAIMARNIFRNSFVLSITGTSTSPVFGVSDDSGTSYGISGTGLVSIDARGGLVIAGSTLLTVPSGGTGATSFTTNGVLYGNGTSALQVTAVGVNRKFLAAHTGTAPTFEFLPEASFSSEGIITFNSPPDFTNGQVLGNGLKMADQFAVGTLTGPLTANNLFECNGESLFFDPLRIAADSAIPGIIEAYDAGNTGMKIEFVPRATTLDVFRTIIRSGSNTFKAQMNADGTDGNDTFDLVHSSTNTPRFAVGGTKGITQSDVAVATVKGGIITAAEATGSSFLSRNFLGI